MSARFFRVPRTVGHLTEPSAEAIDVVGTSSQAAADLAHRDLGRIGYGLVTVGDSYGPLFVVAGEFPSRVGLTARTIACSGRISSGPISEIQAPSSCAGDR